MKKYLLSLLFVFSCSYCFAQEIIMSVNTEPSPVHYYPHFTYYCTSNYIQNQTIDVNSYYDSTPLNIGYDVTNTEPYGNVLIKSGSKLTIKNGNGSVSIKNGFGCEKGAELNIE